MVSKGSIEGGVYCTAVVNAHAGAYKTLTRARATRKRKTLEIHRAYSFMTLPSFCSLSWQLQTAHSKLLGKKKSSSLSPTALFRHSTSQKRLAAASLLFFYTPSPRKKKENFFFTSLFYDGRREQQLLHTHATTLIIILAYILRDATAIFTRGYIIYTKLRISHAANNRPPRASARVISSVQY